MHTYTYDFIGPKVMQVAYLLFWENYIYNFCCIYFHLLIFIFLSLHFLHNIASIIASAVVVIKKKEGIYYRQWVYGTNWLEKHMYSK